MDDNSFMTSPTWRLILRFVLFASLSIALALLSQYNFLLFHTIIELISIVIGFSTFIFIWNSRAHVENSFYIIIGISFLFISLLDVAHTLTYHGLGIFPGIDANPPTQFWVAARSIQAVSCVIALLCMRRKPNIPIAFVGYSIVTGGLIVLITLGIFPEFFIIGEGLTSSKVAAELLIISIMGIASVLLVRKQKEFAPELFRLTIAAFVLMIAAEVFFTSYQDLNGYMNMAGHLMKVTAYYLIYLSIIDVGLCRPRVILHTQLEEALAKTYIQATTDMLTQISNRRHFYEQFNHEFYRSIRYSHPLSVMMVDIDDFKKINDTWGHLTGDAVLTSIANLMRQQLRTVDLIGRFGGEEFVLALPDTTAEQSAIVAERIRARIEGFRFLVGPSLPNQVFRLTVSIGIGQRTENTIRPDDLIDCADRAMYQAKHQGKNRVICQLQCEEKFNETRISLPDLEG